MERDKQRPVKRHPAEPGPRRDNDLNHTPRRRGQFPQPLPHAATSYIACLSAALQRNIVILAVGATGPVPHVPPRDGQ